MADNAQLDTPQVRSRLIAASTIFEYPPLSNEDPVATFLRTCAIQNFISTELVSLLKRQYYAVMSTAGEDEKSVLDPTDSVLDAVSNVPAATLFQELSWRLTMVDKLDRLKSHSLSTQSSAISTKPDEQKIVQGIINKFHHFQKPVDSLLKPKLAEVVSTAVKIWSALRRDDCRIEFETSPEADNGKHWSFVDCSEIGNSPDASIPLSEIDTATLPTTSFVLFPRVTAVFPSDGNLKPCVLHEGIALSHKSPAFIESLQEKQHIQDQIKNKKKELQRGRRTLSSAQSSPTTERRPSDWPTLQN